MFFARTSNSVDISFGLFFFGSNSQWCPASVPREKLRNVPVKKKSHRGAWSMPAAQTTTLSDHDESTNRSPVARPNSIVLAFTFHPGKDGADCSSCFICGRFAQQQTNKASSPPINVHSMGYRAHALSPQ